MLRILLVAAVSIAAAGCAPRVGKRGPRNAAKNAKPAAVAAAAPEPAPRPAPAPAPAPVAEPEPAPPPRRSAPPPEPTPAAPVKADPKKRDSYYAFTDSEIDAMKKRSRPFRSLHQSYESCSKKASDMISRREEIPEEIARLRIEGLDDKKKAKVDALNAERKQLDKTADEQLAQCKELEGSLTDMLRNYYGETVAAR